MNNRSYTALFALLLSFLFPAVASANTVTETFTSNGSLVVFQINFQQNAPQVYYLYDEDNQIVGAWDAAGYSYAPLGGTQPDDGTVYSDYAWFEFNSLPAGEYRLEVSSHMTIYYVYVDVY
ncbi:MAG: hypothetical protein Q7P63_00990 [Verrucomicrobiota bacterium JB022]|nr:hypothetical protein [Verrucomicrobiota bacterium JB022]